MSCCCTHRHTADLLHFSTGIPVYVYCNYAISLIMHFFNLLYSGVFRCIFQPVIMHSPMVYSFDLIKQIGMENVCLLNPFVLEKKKFESKMEMEVIERSNSPHFNFSVCFFPLVGTFNIWTAQIGAINGTATNKKARGASCLHHIATLQVSLACHSLLATPPCRLGTFGLMQSRRVFIWRRFRLTNWKDLFQCGGG